MSESANQEKQANQPSAPAQPKAAAKKLLDVPADQSVLPDRPWSVNPNCKNNLVDRYGKDGAEEMYRRVALKHGHFDPRTDSGYRPDLEPGDQIGEVTEQR